MKNDGAVVERMEISEDVADVLSEVSEDAPGEDLQMFPWERFRVPVWVVLPPYHLVTYHKKPSFSLVLRMNLSSGGVPVPSC